MTAAAVPAETVAVNRMVPAGMVARRDPHVRNKGRSINVHVTAAVTAEQDVRIIVVIGLMAAAVPAAVMLRECEGRSRAEKREPDD